MLGFMTESVQISLLAGWLAVVEVSDLVQFVLVVANSGLLSPSPSCLPFLPTIALACAALPGTWYLVQLDSSCTL